MQQFLDEALAILDHQPEPVAPFIVLAKLSEKLCQQRIHFALFDAERRLHLCEPRLRRPDQRLEVLHVWIPKDFYVPDKISCVFGWDTDIHNRRITLLLFQTCEIPSPHPGIGAVARTG
jgi:hypothetical protein